MKLEESKLQQACVRWFNLQYPHWRMLLFAVPNGGSRSLTEAVRFKKEGVVPGVSDLILLVPNSKMQILCVEMKTRRGQQTENQKFFQISIENSGNKYAVCRSFDDFVAIVKNHLKE